MRAIAAIAAIAKSRTMRPMFAHLPQLALAGLAALAASTLGGLTGFGTGLVLPAFLAPLVGVTHVVPVLAVAMLFNNGSRVLAFRHELDGRHALRILLFGLPACAAGAYGYALLDPRGVSLLLGTFLLLVVPFRRLAGRTRVRVSPTAEVLAGACFGFVNGGVAGAGVILIAVLMGSGLAGSALVATDALVSLLMGVAKVVLFGRLAALDGERALVGLLIGGCTVPGAFIARGLLRRLPLQVHAAVMECVIVCGAVSLLLRA